MHYKRVDPNLIDDKLFEEFSYLSDYEGYIYIPSHLIEFPNLLGSSDEYEWIKWPESQDYLQYQDKIFLLYPDDSGRIMSSEYMVPRDLIFVVKRNNLE